MSFIDLEMTIVNATAETFTLVSQSPSAGNWETQPPATIGPDSSVDTKITSNLHDVRASATYSGTLNGETTAFTVTSVIPSVGSNQYTSTVTPTSALIITNDMPSGWSSQVTFTVADSLQPGDILSFKSMGSHSKIFMNGNIGDGTVSLRSAYDTNAHPGLNWKLYQTPATAGSFYLECQGEDSKAYLNGHTSSGRIDLDSTYDADDGGMHWSLIAVSGQNGKYKIKCLGGKDYVWLNGRTSTGVIELSRRWNSSDGSLTWAIFDGVQSSPS